MAESDKDCDWSALEFRRPAFCPVDLRLMGDPCADPLTKTVRNDVLAFGAPVWFDAIHQLPVLVSAGWSSNALELAIRRGALHFAEAVDWSAGFSALESAFALKREPHLFRAEPSAVWVTSFTEPQLTKGFAHFLNAVEPATRITRVRALLKGLGAAELGNDMSEVKVTAEAQTSRNKRIDLLIEWNDSSNKQYAAAIEAKLGHHVTSGQLPAYRTHLRKFAEERRLLAVVSPRPSRATTRALQRNRDWRWIAWRDLLVAHERALPVDCDDEGYLRFRRTLWDQTD
ncbi:MAG: PD-(D/E)XK nuclease family protein [Gammaproteobacteria bacterium]|nr:PD-(D/E)XK nuclease family protein [Gammaproteobacteria bacterium]